MQSNKSINLTDTHSKNLIARYTIFHEISHSTQSFSSLANFRISLHLLPAAVYIYRFVCPFLNEIVNIYSQDKTYHKLTSDLIPHANYLHKIKEL
ncbi:hypothetical protein F2E49_15555, partial [Salmonella enterica]|nr:hypothetical protein [Salmonella enterica]